LIFRLDGYIGYDLKLFLLFSLAQKKIIENPGPKRPDARLVFLLLIDPFLPVRTKEEIPFVIG